MTEIQKAIKEVVKTFRKYNLTYDQVQYISKKARAEVGITKNQKKKQVIDRLSKLEQEKFINQAYKKNGYIGLLVKTLFFSGARVSEFVEIKAEDFLFEEQQILIKKAKGGKQRTIPITKELAQELKSYLSTKNNKYLFESKRYDKYSTRRIQQIVKEIALEAGITKKVHPHLLRHTVATFLLEKGMPIEKIQIFLGHERIENTRIYAKTSAKDIEEAFREVMKTI